MIRPSWLGTRGGATLFAGLAIALMVGTASRLTDCSERLDRGGEPGKPADFAQLCEIGTEKANREAEERSYAELEDVILDPQTKCACNLAGLHAHRMEAATLFATTLAFALLALVAAWRAEPGPATATFALFTALTAYGYGLYFYASALYDFAEEGPHRLIYPPDVPGWGVADALAIVAWIAAPLALAQFTRFHPSVLTSESQLLPLRRVFARARVAHAGSSTYRPSRLQLTVVWLSIAWLYSILAPEIRDPLLLFVSTTLVAIALIVVQWSALRRRGKTEMQRDVLIATLLVVAVAAALAALYAIERTRGHVPRDAVLIPVFVAMVALVTVHIRRTLALASLLVILPVLVNTALQLRLVAPNHRDFVSPAVHFGFLCFLIAVVNFGIGYRQAASRQRRAARWMALGFLASALMLVIDELRGWLWPNRIAVIYCMLSFCEYRPGLSFFALPVLAAFLAISIFYRGELDPRLVLWRGTVYALVMVVTGALFGLVEHAVAHYMSAILFTGAPPTIAACVSAVAVKPIKDGCERLVELGVHRLTSTA